MENDSIDDSEAKIYLTDANVSHVSILDVWRGLESSFPVMAQMAKDVLAVPVSGVGVERLFSMARDVVTYRRCRLRGSTIEQIMMIKRTNWDKRVEDVGLEKSSSVNESDDLELADEEPEPITHWASEEELTDDEYGISTDQATDYDDDQSVISPLPIDDRSHRRLSVSSALINQGAPEPPLPRLQHHGHSNSTTTDQSSQVRVEIPCSDHVNLREYVLDGRENQKREGGSMDRSSKRSRLA